MSKDNRKKFGLFFFFLMFPELYYENFFTNAIPKFSPWKMLVMIGKTYLYQVQLWGFWFWAIVVVQLSSSVQLFAIP